MGRRRGVYTGRGDPQQRRVELRRAQGEESEHPDSLFTRFQADRPAAERGLGFRHTDAPAARSPPPAPCPEPDFREARTLRVASCVTACRVGGAGFWREDLKEGRRRRRRSCWGLALWKSSQPRVAEERSLRVSFLAEVPARIC